MCRHLGFGSVCGLVALHLVRDGIGRAQVRLHQREHLLFERGSIRHLQLARFFRGLFSKLDNGLDRRLEMTMAEHHGAEHHLFAQFLCLGLDH